MIDPMCAWVATSSVEAITEETFVPAQIIRRLKFNTDLLKFHGCCSCILFVRCHSYLKELSPFWPFFSLPVQLNFVCLFTETGLPFFKKIVG